MSAVQVWLGAGGSNWRSTRFAATGRPWLESVVQRNFRFVLAATPAWLMSLATVLTLQDRPQATNSAWMRGLP